MRSGNELALYCFGELAGVPAGVELRDASEILRLEDMLEISGGRADLYSDWFRYELLDRGVGTWVDTDIYALRQIDGSEPYLFGEQGGGLLNNAVLRLPPGSKILSRLLEPFRRRTTPKWMRADRYLAMRIRELLSGRVDLTKAPWGTTSPFALTALTTKLGLRDLAQPASRFYPVPYQEADWVLDGARHLEDVIEDGTVAVHLWNECIKGYKSNPAPTGSFLARLQAEGRE
jgi:hypothetical protein